MFRRVQFVIFALMFTVVIPYDVFAENEIIRRKVKNIVLTGDNRLTVVAKGITHNTRIMNGGIEDVFPGGVSRKAVIQKGGRLWLAGGKAYDATIERDGLMEVRQHQGKSSYALNTDVYDGGRLNVFANSSAEKITIHKGGLVRVFLSDAIISNVNVLSGGVLHVWKQGRARNVEVFPGGLLDLREESPVLEGSIWIAGQLKASFNQTPDVSKAQIVLDLTKRNSDDDYCIVNFDFLGKTNIYVMVSANQEPGEYKLASGAESSGKPWNLTVDGGKIFQLVPGRTISVSGRKYTVNNKNNNAFVLEVASEKVASEMHYFEEQ